MTSNLLLSSVARVVDAATEAQQHRHHRFTLPRPLSRSRDQAAEEERDRITRKNLWRRRRKGRSSITKKERKSSNSRESGEPECTQQRLYVKQNKRGHKHSSLSLQSFSQLGAQRRLGKCALHAAQCVSQNVANDCRAKVLGGEIEANIVIVDHVADTKAALVDGAEAEACEVGAAAVRSGEEPVARPFVGGVSKDGGQVTTFGKGHLLQAEQVAVDAQAGSAIA